MKMLKKYLNVSAVLVATASLTLAQPPGGRGRDEGPDSNVDRMFNHDGNEDGKLGKDEVPERLQGIFARADKDEDGFLNKEEVRAYFQSQAEGQGRGRGGREGGGGREGARSREGGGRGGFGGRGESGAGPGGPRDMPPFPVMMALDADGNGEISADEINNATAALKKLDRNRNGKLDADELRPSFGGGREGGFGGGPPGGGRGGIGGQSFVEGMLGRYDENKDGKLAGDEIPERMRDRVEQIDTNKDKAIDKAELEAMTRQFGSDRGGEAGRGRGGEGGGGQRQRPPIEEEK
jgi:Ca2+-binding EF-hand superfamily protein